MLDKVFGFFSNIKVIIVLGVSSLLYYLIRKVHTQSVELDQSKVDSKAKDTKHEFEVNRAESEIKIDTKSNSKSDVKLSKDGGVLKI